VINIGTFDEPLKYEHTRLLYTAEIATIVLSRTAMVAMNWALQ